MARYFTLLLAVAFESIMAWRPPDAQTPDSTQIKQLEQEVAALRSDLKDLKGEMSDKVEAGFVFFLFGGFCALWAQNTGRSPWLWFFLVALFNIITLLL
jgi:fatty acid desaturase